MVVWMHKNLWTDHEKVERNQKMVGQEALSSSVHLYVHS